MLGDSAENCAINCRYMCMNRGGLVTWISRFSVLFCCQDACSGTWLFRLFRPYTRSNHRALFWLMVRLTAMDATWQMHLRSRHITSAKSRTSSVDIQVEGIMDKLIKWHQPNGAPTCKHTPFLCPSGWLDTIRADISYSDTLKYLNRSDRPHITHHVVAKFTELGGYFGSRLPDSRSLQMDRE